MATAEEQLTQAESLLAGATAAYVKALAVPQYVQSNQRRAGQHELDKLLANIDYWQKRVDKLSAAVNKTARPGLCQPLRPYL